MCLAVVGKVVQVEGDCALIDVEGVLLNINIQLTPKVSEGSYLLIHAGFAIATMEQEEFFETQALLNQISSVLDQVT